MLVPRRRVPDTAQGAPEPTRAAAAAPSSPPPFAVVLVLLTVGAVRIARSDATGPAAPAPSGPGPVSVRLIAFNDLHGNLEPPAGSSGRVTTDDGTTVDAGGAAFLAAHVARLRAEAPNTVLFSAGDNVGASPAASALFHDEPTIDLLDSLGVAASVVGNHEFDEGCPSCSASSTAAATPPTAARSARLRRRHVPVPRRQRRRRGRVAAPAASTVVETGGVRIGVIGVTLHDLPTVVSADAMRGLTFGDEVARSTGRPTSSPPRA